MFLFEYTDWDVLQSAALQMHFSPTEPCQSVVLLQMLVSSKPQDRTKTRFPSLAFPSNFMQDFGQDIFSENVSS